MADTNAKLEALGNEIKSQIDDLAEDPSGGQSPVRAEGGDSGDDSPEPPPPPPPAAHKAPAPKPAVAPEPSETPEQGPMSATGAQPPAPAAPAAAAPPPQAVSEADLLKDYTRDEIDALRKYAPGGKITTPEILREARAKFASNYWENSRKLAELTQGKGPTPDTPAAPPEEASLPPELARFEPHIQATVTRAKSIIANITGWQKTRAEKIQMASDLQARRNRGDSTVDPDDISAAWNEVHQIDGYINGWQGKYAEQKEKFDDLLARRDEVRLLLETRDRLDRQAREEATQDEEFATQEYYNEWSKHLKELATEHKVPPHRLAKLEKDAKAATFFAATSAPIEDTRAFLNDFVKEFMEPLAAAKQEGAEDYIKRKAADAPRQPAPGKPVAEEPAQPASLTPHDALRSLERRVMSDDAWEKMGAAQ